VALPYQAHQQKYSEPERKPDLMGPRRCELLRLLHERWGRTTRRVVVLGDEAWSISRAYSWRDRRCTRLPGSLRPMARCYGCSRSVFSSIRVGIIRWGAYCAWQSRPVDLSMLLPSSLSANSTNARGLREAVGNGRT